MKRCLSILIGVLVFLFSVSFVQAEERRISANLNLGYYSDYISGMHGLTIHDHPVLQQSIALNDNPSGLYVKVWSSYSPKGGINSDFGDELEYIAGIAMNFGRVGVDVGYAFYNLYDIKNTEGDLHAVYLNLDLPKIYKAKPYITIEGNIPEDKDVLEGGVMWKAGIKRNIKLLNLNLSVGGHDGTYGKKPEPISFVKLNIAAPFQIWKINITPEVSFQKELGYAVENGGITEDKIWYGINFSIPLF